MPDRDKTLTGLEKCSHDICWDDCPYGQEDPNCCHENMARDAYELLKEQPKIVLCKDCANYKPWNDEKEAGKIRGGCKWHRTMCRGDWFCADGVEKKYNGGDEM